MEAELKEMRATDQGDSCATSGEDIQEKESKHYLVKWGVGLNPKHI